MSRKKMQRPIVWDPILGAWRYGRANEMNFSYKGQRKTWSARVRRRIAYRDGEWCYLCEAELPLDDLTVDHVIPTARGGTNDLSNLKLACFRCNNDKGDMTLDEYRASLIDTPTDE